MQSNNVEPKPITYYRYTKMYKKYVICQPTCFFGAVQTTCKYYIKIYKTLLLAILHLVVMCVYIVSKMD
jgi:hypothetical protein